MWLIHNREHAVSTSSECHAWVGGGDEEHAQNSMLSF